MPRPPTYYHPLRDIRKRTTFATQAQFAKLVGVSPPTIQAIENGKLEISQKLSKRIERATGADHRELKKGGNGKPRTILGQKYSREFFEDWHEQRNQFGDTSTSHSEDLNFWLQILLDAAGSSTTACTKQTVYHRVVETLDSVCLEHDMEATVERCLRPFKKVEYCAADLQSWKSESDELSAAISKMEHKFHHLARLNISMERIPRWTPGRPSRHLLG